MGSVFDPNPGCCPEAEWREMLGGLVESLSAHTGIRFAPTSWFIEDHPGHASAGGCVDVRGAVSPALRLEACGVVCISVNHGEAAWASADVLLFSGGRRVLGPDGREVVHFRYTPDGWSDVGWVNGECGEWELDQYPTDARWRHAEPSAAADRGRMCDSGEQPSEGHHPTQSVFACRVDGRSIYAAVSCSEVSG